MENIQVGDTVRHKTRILISGGLAFNVLEVEGTKALCEFFDTDPDQTTKQEWFDISDLILIHKVEGGFRNLGES
ncbi:hypothetical protein [Limnovirga soli]|uniref:DUF2158 domain-containing protein n=1 Tax=Limnovirga soli TaxID=2656915 RepID=A0A8J8FCI0_9BACT|nr:hypothetical protein [Limnovirga soli]NNV53849.1 hypothetical protein [Limnovirga soli]